MQYPKLFFTLSLKIIQFYGVKKLLNFNTGKKIIPTGPSPEKVWVTNISLIY